MSQTQPRYERWLVYLILKLRFTLVGVEITVAETESFDVEETRCELPVARSRSRSTRSDFDHDENRCWQEEIICNWLKKIL